MTDVRLSAEQFAAVWFSTGWDRLPFPFRFTSRFTLLDEFESFQAETRNTLNEPRHAPLRQALSVLAQPDWRIELFGSSGGPGVDGTQLRTLGCGRRDGSLVIATQEPAEDGGPVTIRSCRDLATAVAQTIPTLSPGTGTEKRFLLDDLNDTQPDPYGQRASSETKARYARFWQQPAQGRGTLTVIMGARGQDERGIGRLRWLDVADGRYLEVTSNGALMIRPGSQREIAKYLGEVGERARTLADRAATY
ncbi:ESX secretion-associated protein EspG [Nocardia stercoris]|uniref:ESX secretion-associated protein EspG n=1 Tax=Nocardia stercoris TaxID=2483361 RepID=UPI00131A3347|nr:ESX secretion-associated protein EspG [Nocardia stercoris]